MSSKKRVSIPGSERAALPGARAVGAPHPEERIEVLWLVEDFGPCIAAVDDMRA